MEGGMIKLTMFSSVCLLAVLLSIGTGCQTGYLRVLNYPWGFRACVSKSVCVGRNNIIYGTTCQPACPYNTYMYEDTRTCYDKCPNDTVHYESQCVNATFCTSKSQVLYNGSCHTSCPCGAPFTRDGTCVSSCPGGTVPVNRSLCVTTVECKRTGRFISNSSCVTECPTEEPFHLLQVCFTECPENSFISSNGTCLSKQKCLTDNKGVIFNKTCINDCPDVAKYEHLGVCYSTCPKQTYLNGSRCISSSSCVLNNMFIYGDRCIAKCPNEASYHKDNRCLSRCPTGTVEYRGECVQENYCIEFYKLYKVIFNGSCVDACPVQAPISNSGRCVDVCPDGSVARFMQCVSRSSCSEMFIYNNTCVESCPSESPLSANKICCNACPESFVRLESQCVTVNQCRNLKRVIFNETCLLECPKGYPYIDPNNTCNHQCPSDLFEMEHQCISFDRCTRLKKLVFNKTCTATCPDDVRYIVNDTCVEKCPKGLLTLGYRCVTEKSCITEKRFMINSTCIETCPDDVRYIVNDTCVEKCPKGLLTLGYRCVTEKSCIAEKRFLYNNSCLQSCPSKCSYSSNYHCKSVCPNNTFHVLGEKTCVSSSACKAMGRSIANRTCTKSCPENMPLSYKGNCYSKCPSGLLAKNSLCVQKYECSLKVGYKCVTSCPDNAPYKDFDTCYTTCPDDKLNFHGTQCLYSSECTYSNNRYKYEGECVEICPKGSYLYKEMSTCMDGMQIKIYVIIYVAVLVLSITLVVSCIYIPKTSRSMNGVKVWKEEDELRELEENMDNISYAFDHQGVELQEQIPLCGRLESGRAKDERDCGLGTVKGAEAEADDNLERISASGRSADCNVIIHGDPKGDGDEALLICHHTGNEDEDEDDAILFGDGGS